MRNLKPSEFLSNTDSQKALRLVIRDGIFSEAMVTLTTGAFLTALALQLGASNFQIGLLSAIPTLANLFPFVAISLLRKLPNRRLLTVITTFLSRIPLLAIGIVPFFLEPGTALVSMIALFFFHQTLGAISGTIWTSWMKDIVPSEQLGSFFSRRSKIITYISLALSLVIAGILDYMKKGFPEFELAGYSSLFLIGGALGLAGVFLLAKTPEPVMEPVKFKFGKSFSEPLRDKNYRTLLIFQSLWGFATNLAVPFYTMYQLTMLKLPVSLVIFFTILNQLAIALFVRIWGMYSDKFSNKTILKICAPVYLGCIFMWTYTSMPAAHGLTIPMVAALHFISGAAFAGINLAITNISIKLAPKENTVSYISVKAMIVALISGVAPLLTGFFSGPLATGAYSLKLDILDFHFSLMELHSLDFFFIAAVLTGILSLFILKLVKEEGEAKANVVVRSLVRSVQVNGKKTVRYIQRFSERRAA